MEVENSDHKDLKFYLRKITKGNLRELILQVVCEAIVQYKFILDWKVKNKVYRLNVNKDNNG
jgi:hypothetical protein